LYTLSKCWKTIFIKWINLSNILSSSITYEHLVGIKYICFNYLHLPRSSKFKLSLAIVRLPRTTRWFKKEEVEVKEEEKWKLPPCGGDGHLYNTTSSQCSVMTEDYCAAPLRSSNCAVWLKMTRHFGARARNYILKINADVYISGFETFAPSAENV